jgi:hypothetical protein
MRASRPLAASQPCTRNPRQEPLCA